MSDMTESREFMDWLNEYHQRKLTIEDGPSLGSFTICNHSGHPPAGCAACGLPPRPQPSRWTLEP